MVVIVCREIWQQGWTSPVSRSIPGGSAFFFFFLTEKRLFCGSQVSTRITVKRRWSFFPYTQCRLWPRSLCRAYHGRLAWLAALTHSEEPSWRSHWVMEPGHRPST